MRRRLVVRGGGEPARGIQSQEQKRASDQSPKGEDPLRRCKDRSARERGFVHASAVAVGDAPNYYGKNIFTMHSRSLSGHDHCGCYDFLMAKRRKKYDIRDFQLTGDALAGYTYFVFRDLDAKAIRWELVAPNGDTLCSSGLFYDKAECLKTLRAVQRRRLHRCTR